MSTSLMKHEYRVLIAEDDANFAEILAEFLRFYFDIVLTGTKADTIKECADTAKEIHCILLDVKLPNGQGKEMVVELRSLFPTVPILPMSGYDFTASEMIAVGAHDFLRKPFTMEELQEKLINTIARNKAWEKISPLIQRKDHDEYPSPHPVPSAGPGPATSTTR